MNHEHEASQELINEALGVFSLPVESVASDHPMPADASPRQGASQSTWNHDDHANTAAELSTEDEFPMIVWLRGDEPWYSEFDMDADAAMDALSIKRSRLTQIAGKELRVGRVRVDRYIRPVFRSRDIEQYLNQTRATASHQKSSDVINSAAGLLCQQVDRMEARLEVINQNLMTQMESALQKVLTETLGTIVSGTTERLDALEGDIVNRLSVLTQDTVLKHVGLIQKDLFATSSELLSQMESSKEELTQAQQLHEKSVKNLAAKTAELEEKLSHIAVEIKHSENALRQDLRTIISDIAHFRKPDKINAKKIPDNSAVSSGIRKQSASRATRHTPARRKPHKMR
jgi:hypothetical protein